MEEERHIEEMISAMERMLAKAIEESERLEREREEAAELERIREIAEQAGTSSP